MAFLGDLNPIHRERRLEALEDHMSAPETTVEDAVTDSRTRIRRELPAGASRGRADAPSSQSVVVIVGSTDRGSCNGAPL
jgi:hypothetical protein